MIPRGNPLIENIALPFEDINIMINNLEQQAFTGFVEIEYQIGTGFIFFLHGGIINTLELNDSALQNSNLRKLRNKIRNKESKVSSYYLNVQLANVLSQSYIFKNLYSNYKVDKEKLQNILHSFEEESFVGFWEVLLPIANSYLVFDKGKIVSDNFNDSFGQIICGAEKIQDFFILLAQGEAKLNIYTAKNSEIEFKKKLVQEELEKIKQLIVKVESRFLRGSNDIKVDEYIIKEWLGTQTLGSNFFAELETPEGNVYKIKCSLGKKLGGQAAISIQNAKNFNLKDGDIINIKPLL